ncbi:nucleoside-diphosphate sugar epimerase/dehydratase [Bdellovibrionales bacterium]|nr:nucleoside-diphosphate sugar epimerase/dehydratase [Bdellovibrionales bacterium]
MKNKIARRVRAVRLRHFLPDLVVVLGSLYLSLYLRVGIGGFYEHLPTLNGHVTLALAIKMASLVLLGNYNIMWRYISALDAFRLTRIIFISSSVFMATSLLLADYFGRLPRSIYFIDFFVVMIGLMGMRLLRRLFYERQYGNQVRAGKRTLIYGAGSNGRVLSSHFRSDPGQAANLIGFVDDAPAKQGISIAGTTVLGSGDDLERLIEKHEITQVIIAASDMPGEKVRDVLRVTRPHNIMPRIMTNTRLKAEIDKSTVALDRDINLTDLLNRPPRYVDIASVRDMVRGRRVLVTGAGGSIGSEISRQIIENDPSRLLILDHSEYNLYNIDKELRLNEASISKVVPLLLDLKDRDTLVDAMRQFTPEVVFHVAAYKHVHLVEANPYSAILNNVKSTKNLLEASEEVKVENFVLISTDKAVNPAGVMGATKRVCELMTNNMAKKTGKKYSSVRFGNVLGSSGSLIPLLKSQIKKGGPVTVTHKDMTRFFMLIPESVSLVLRSATITKPGDINILKMGEPIKIVDIVESLISLMGRAEEEIPIVFTGLRPGEKLFEELYLTGDELGTEHPDIMVVPQGRVKESDVELYANLDSEVEQMIEAAQQSDSEAIYQLNHLVKSTYTPPANVREESEAVNFLIVNSNSIQTKH